MPKKLKESLTKAGCAIVAFLVFGLLWGLLTNFTSLGRFMAPSRRCNTSSRTSPRR